ncbi:uncharacterized protein LOC125888934 [Epinephelus fuscoguttatus]|uniref:uncharacterized protein LOC125888934 n=1 Tax=Epinephelus fuscoguttatus TaxID=293821 RepID=UPI0020CFF07F|nr:uncharacterized protein LOC125888934 [Epinephelus fuscoguttatus]
MLMDCFVREKLREWQLDSLIDTFEDQEADEESFMLLDDSAIASLIPKVGQRVKFQRHHKELVTISSNPRSSEESHSLVESLQMGTVESIPTDSLSVTVQLYPTFAIRQILNGTLEGKAIVKSLDEQQSITSKHRRLLVRLLVSHGLLENNGETPSSDTKKALAMSLVYEFPCLKDDTGNGYGAWYTPGRKQRPATGFLEERLRNVRKRLRKLNRPRHQELQENHTVCIPESVLPPEKLQEKVDWLKVHKFPVSEVEAYMRETAIYRGKWIRSNGSKSIPEILKAFPRLVDNPGMISQDFEQLYPEAAPKLFEKWAAVSDRILAYAQREGKLHLVLDDMTPVANSERALTVLPTLLPQSIYKDGGKVVRPTTEESRRSFIKMQPVGTNMVDYLQNAETGEDNIPGLHHFVRACNRNGLAAGRCRFVFQGFFCF